MREIGSREASERKPQETRQQVTRARTGTAHRKIWVAETVSTNRQDLPGSTEGEQGGKGTL